MFSVMPFESKTLSWWYTKKNKIDIQPPYQRRSGLWNDRDKAFLIDSILNEFDIPKLYMADFTFGNSELNVKNLPYAIIDGKQRLEAIFDFFDGSLVLSQEFEYLDNPALNLKGLSYNDLKNNYSEIASRFENFNLSVMRVVTNDEAKINDLFVRLNRSKALTGAEIRNAMRGRVPLLIRNISNHAFFKTKIRFSITRGEDLNAAAKLLLCEFRGKLVDTKKYNLDRFVEEGVKSQIDTIDRAYDRVIKTLDKCCNIFINKDALLGGAGILPVYYWFVRTLDPDKLSSVREYLVNFNRALKFSRDKTVEQDADKTKVFTLYNNLNRSTNDQNSHEGRYLVLYQLFNDYK